MKQRFDFDNIKIGDRLKSNGVEAEYVLFKNIGIHNQCDDCAYGNFGCENIPCDRHHVWKKVDDEEADKAGA